MRRVRGRRRGRRLNLRVRRRGGRRHRRNYSHWIPAYSEASANPRRKRRGRRGRKHNALRRRRRRNNTYITPRYVMNPRRGRRRRGRNARFRYRSKRRGRRNTGCVGLSCLNPRTAVRTLTAGLDPSVIRNLYPTAAGGVLNEFTSTFAASLGFVPTALKSGAGRVVLNLITAAGNATLVRLVSGIAPKVIKSQWSGPVFAGGVVQALMEATRQLILPGVKAAFGLSDYLSVEDARRAQALGDYLSVEDARRAQALGTYDEFASPEALHPGLGQTAYTPLDYAPAEEQIAAMELATL